MSPEEEIRWNVLMRFARRGYGLVGTCYGDTTTMTTICFWQTASMLTPEDVA